MMPIYVRKLEARRRYRALRPDPPGIASQTWRQRPPAEPDLARRTEGPDARASQPSA